jgi:hypothetical protein
LKPSSKKSDGLSTAVSAGGDFSHGPDEPVLASDSDPRLAPIGQTPIVRVSPSRDHRHCYGALDVRRGPDIAVATQEETTAMTVTFLMMRLLLFPTQPILLLLDRAPWHAGPELDLLLADNPR